MPLAALYGVHGHALANGVHGHAAGPHSVPASVISGATTVRRDAILLISLIPFMLYRVTIQLVQNLLLTQI